MTSRTLAPNQVSRFARHAVNAKPPPPPSASTTNANDDAKRKEGWAERSQFAARVERDCTLPENTRHSLIYRTLGDKFPYLQMMAASVDCGFLTPPQIAAVYVVARSRPADWAQLCARSERFAITPTSKMASQVDAYFAAAGAPAHEELHEMHSMFTAFMSDGAALKIAMKTSREDDHRALPAIYSAMMKLVNLIDASQFQQPFGVSARAPSKSTSVPDSELTCMVVLKAFTNNAVWFERQ